MAAEHAERPSGPQDELGELLHRVGQLRWRLAREQALRLLARGLGVGALIVIAVSALVQLSLAPRQPLLLAIAVSAPLLALTVAAMRWPTLETAARTADRRLGLEERLGTAVELAPALRGGHGGPLDGLQIRDALHHVQPLPGWRRPRGWVRDLLLALAALAVAAAAAWLTQVGTFSQTFVTAPPAQSEAGSAADTASTPTAVAQPASAPAPPPPASATAQQHPAAGAPASAQRVAQEQAQRAALDRLAEGLQQTSATRGAGQAMARGDYTSAANQLNDLGTQADQLSDAAKQQLAQTLQKTASASSGDRQLAQREQQAAEALQRGDYSGQQQALQQLAAQVQRSGANAPTSDQLQRDQGQLQADSGGSQGPSTAANQPDQSGNGGSSGPASAGDGQGQSAGGTSGGNNQAQSGGSGDQSNGGPGVGTGTTASMLGDPAPPLNSAGQRVDVPIELSAGSATKAGTSDPNQSDESVRGGATGA
ncbi:MAG: hypothetical protein JO023_12325, partial [Chloroflexi bacterium]|nr:hypothetical protein [Chloroflexota bacterium]